MVLFCYRTLVLQMASKSSNMSDCQYTWIPGDQVECAYYDGQYQDPKGNLWMVLTGAVGKCL